MFFFIAYNQNISAGRKQTTGLDTANGVTFSQETEKKYTIGWSVYDSDYEFFQAMQDGVISRAAELGINVIAHNQDSSTVEMITGASSLIEQGIDALLISPFNPEAMPVITDLAKKAGIPVVVIDVGTGGTDVDAFIITDSFAGGSLAGEYAMELIRKHSIPSKNIAILKVEETSKYARRRGEGFKDVLSHYGYNVVSEITANSDQLQAYEATKNILADFRDDLAVVFAENDRMALGAAQAIDEAGKKGQILVIGFDGDPSAIEAIQNGRMQGTIAQQPFEMGVLGVDVVFSLLNGKRIIYDDVESKTLYVEIYLIDETGNPRKYMKY